MSVSARNILSNSIESFVLVDIGIQFDKICHTFFMAVSLRIPSRILGSIWFECHWKTSAYNMQNTQRKRDKLCTESHKCLIFYSFHSWSCIFWFKKRIFVYSTNLAEEILRIHIILTFHMNAFYVLFDFRYSCFHFIPHFRDV